MCVQDFQVSFGLIHPSLSNYVKFIRFEATFPLVPLDSCRLELLLKVGRWATGALEPTYPMGLDALDQ